MSGQIFLAATKSSYIFTSACTSCLSASACLLPADKEGQTLKTIKEWTGEATAALQDCSDAATQDDIISPEECTSSVTSYVSKWMMETRGLHSEPEQVTRKHTATPEPD